MRSGTTIVSSLHCDRSRTFNPITISGGRNDKGIGRTKVGGSMNHSYFDISLNNRARAKIISPRFDHVRAVPVPRASSSRLIFVSWIVSRTRVISPALTFYN